MEEVCHMRAESEKIRHRMATLSVLALSVIGLFGILGRIIGLMDYLIENTDIATISLMSSIAFVLLAIVIFIASSSRLKNPHVILVSNVISFVLIFFSGIVFIDSITGTGIDLQRILFDWAMSDADLQRSHTALVVALGILLGSIGLHLSVVSKKGNDCILRTLIGWLGIIVFSLGSICILGYAYGAPELYGGSGEAPSIAASSALIFLAIGMFALLEPSDWPMRIAFSNEPRFVLMRYFIPLIAIVMLVMGWAIAVAIPVLHSALLVTAIFDILAVVFISILIAKLAGNIDKRLAKAQRERDRALESLRTANEKLHMLDSLTRHDIMNQISLSTAEAELAKRYEPDPKVVKGLDIIIKINRTITGLLRFQKDYQKIGEAPNRWLSMDEILSRFAEQLNFDKISFQNNCNGLMLFADPMIEKAFYNIIENSLRHGGTVTRIEVGYVLPENPPSNPLKLVFEDNGIGIENSEKERIFERDVGRNTGLGLFLTREILNRSGMTVREVGKFGKGARFEISVPHGLWKFNPVAPKIPSDKD